ncbi:hypothetical protein AN641_07525 [Candidatus Epulonipiscioides gigas]|nr:hypothetical protein AN641_07525 [Epulopiscium sp. SCG-C07WGA-EpuloA2]
MKLLKILCNLIFFIPAIIATLLFIGEFIYPHISFDIANLSNIWTNIQESLLNSVDLSIIVGTLWASGFILSSGGYYGGVFALIIPSYEYINSLITKEALVVNILPYIIILSLFYLACAVIVALFNYFEKAITKSKIKATKSHNTGFNLANSIYK